MIDHNNYFLGFNFAALIQVSNRPHFLWVYLRNKPRSCWENTRKGRKLSHKEENYIIVTPSSSTSAIISFNSSSVGFCPSDLMTEPSSDDEIDPPPSLSNKVNASRSSNNDQGKKKF